MATTTDTAMAVADGKLWLIVAGEVATLWRAGEVGTPHGRFEAVNFEAFMFRQDRAARLATRRCRLAM